MQNAIEVDFTGSVSLGEGVLVGSHTVLGFPKEERLIAFRENKKRIRARNTEIGERVIIGNHVVIHEGARVGNDAFIDDFSRIGYDTCIGAESRVTYRAFICDRVNVGMRARIGGFICDASKIGDDVTVMGSLVHEYSTPRSSWEEPDEPAPQLEDGVVVGYNATVVGGVFVGAKSYIAAGAIVTKDVPAGMVVVGVNEHTKYEDWSGVKLSL